MAISVADELSKLKGLLDSGDLTLDEFSTLRGKALGSKSPPVATNTKVRNPVAIIAVSLTLAFWTALVSVVSIAAYKQTLKNQIMDAFGQAFVEDSTKASDVRTPKSKAIVLGEKIVAVDVCEFTIENCYTGTRIDPPNASGYYTYYKAKETDTTYIDVVVMYKNLNGSQVDIDDITSMKLTYDTKYEYKSFSVVESDGGKDFDPYGNVAPLTNAKIHYLFEVPKLVAEGKFDLTFQITDQRYIISLG
jgi:hypothetical protein